MTIILVLFLALALLTCIFAFQNTETISVTFLMWESPELPLALILLTVFVLGAVVGLLASMVSSVKARLAELGAKAQAKEDAARGAEPAAEDAPAELPEDPETKSAEEPAPGGEDVGDKRDQPDPDRKAG